MSIGVRRATAEDDERIIGVLPEVVPEADAARRFAWLYRDNPAGPALTWLAEEDGELVGLTSFFPWRLQVGGEVRRAALGGDGWVAPARRRRGIGKLLHEASRAAMQAEDVLCMYGAPGAMNVTPLLAGGSLAVGDVGRWARPLIAPRALARAWLVEALSRRLLTPRAHGLELDPVRPGDPRVDAAWAATRGELAVACVRDAAFYTWRYLDAPAGVQQAFVVVRRGRPLAACALELTGGTVRIQDLVAPAAAWGPALRAILGWASQRGARLVDVKLAVADGARRRLWRWGFVPRDRKPFLVMVRAGDEAAAAALLDPGRWFYTGGSDSDVDFA